MADLLEWVDWLPGRNILHAKHCGPLFDAPPTLVVLHRPARGLAVAEYFHHSPDDRSVSTHFAPRADGELVQCVSLRRVAWAQGGGVWRGNERLNFCAVSAELPVPMSKPWPRGPSWQTEASNALLRVLAEALPSLVECIGHHDCDPRNRNDPGDLPWDVVLAGTGWACPHRAPRI